MAGKYNTYKRYPPYNLVGDLNSDHNLWNYEHNDKNGETLLDLEENINHQLIVDSKDKPIFFSRRWLKSYNPNLCHFQMQPLPTSRTVLPDFLAASIDM